MGKESAYALEAFLNFCVHEGLLIKAQHEVVYIEVPKTLTCPGIPQDTLQSEALLVSREDLMFLYDRAETCIANADTQQGA